MFEELSIFSGYHFLITSSGLDIYIISNLKACNRRCILRRYLLWLLSIAAKFILIALLIGCCSLLKVFMLKLGASNADTRRYLISVLTFLYENFPAAALSSTTGIRVPPLSHMLSAGASLCPVFALELTDGALFLSLVAPPPAAVVW